MKNISSLLLGFLLTISIFDGSIFQTSSSSIVVEASLYDDSKSKNVQLLKTASEFQEKVMKNPGVAMVQFFAPWCGHCQGLADTYKNVANILNGIIDIVAIDATSENFQSIVSQYKVEGFPTLYIFSEDKNKPEKYTGGRDIQHIVQAIMDAMVKTVEGRARIVAGPGAGGAGGSSSGGGGGASKVVQLTSANFRREVLDNPLVSMVAFVAPWCGHCKALLPDWEQAAKKIDGQGAFLGVVDATVETELAQKFQVQGYPTIKVFPGGPNKSESVATDYQGERTITSIVKFVYDEIDRTGVPKEIPELTSADVMKENCGGSNNLCVLAALPHIADSGKDGRNKYRDLLSSVSKSFRGSSYTFMWFEGGSQPKMENTLELTFGYPALVAISMDKQAYAVQRGSFDEKSISKFLYSIPSGRQSTIKMPDNHGLPESVETVTPWDGKDVEIEEEEFSLADIMGDEF